MPDNLGAFLTFIGTAGFFGWFVTWTFGNWTWFEKASVNRKMLILIIAALSLGFLSRALITYVPAGVIAGLEPWYQTGVASIGVLLSSQIWHEVIHKDGTPAGAALASG